jgi:rhamnose transport system permease protein
LKRRWEGHRHEFILAALAGLLLLGTGVADRLFVAGATQLKLSENIWEMALLALPMTLILIAGGIDLSVGSTMALATVTFGLLVKSGIPFAAAAAGALGVSAAAGWLNGWLVTRMRVHPLLITLASLAAYRGLAEGLSRGRPVTPLPPAFCELAGSLGGVPLPALYFAVLALAAGLFLHRSAHGRFLRALGHQERAAVFSGIPVSGLRTFLHTLAGLIAGFAALIYAARRNTANPESGLGLELDVIAAVVVGGTHINGGRGSIPGTLLGVLIIHEAREFVNWRWSSAELNMVVTGTLLIVSVLAHRLLSPRDRSSGD